MSSVFFSAEAPFKMQINKKNFFKKSLLKPILHQFLSDMYHDIYVYVIRALKGAKHYDIYVYVIRALKGLNFDNFKIIRPDYLIFENFQFFG